MPTPSSICQYVRWVARNPFSLTPRLRRAPLLVALGFIMGLPLQRSVDGHLVYEYDTFLTGGWRVLGIVLGCALIAAHFRYWDTTTRPQDERDAIRDAQREARRAQLPQAIRDQLD